MLGEGFSISFFLFLNYNSFFLQINKQGCTRNFQGGISGQICSEMPFAKGQWKFVFFFFQLKEMWILINLLLETTMVQRNLLKQLKTISFYQMFQHSMVVQIHIGVKSEFWNQNQMKQFPQSQRGTILKKHH